MATGPLEIRMARLEGSYEQVDRRLASIEERLGRLESKIDNIASELRREIAGVNGRVNRLLYGIIVAILVPIAIRIYFP